MFQLTRDYNVKHFKKRFKNYPACLFPWKQSKNIEEAEIRKI